MATLFLSYSRDDVERVEELSADIRSLGHDAWIDQELTGGQRWWDHILEEIRRCDAFVTAVSTSSMDSRACLTEYEYAVALGKPILPVMVQGGVAESLMPPHLSQLQRVDYTEGDKAAFASLNRALTALPPAPPPPEPLPEPPQVPASYLFDLKTEIGAAGTMSGETQAQLVAELRTRLGAGHSRADIASLVRRFRQRDDLLVRTDQELGSLEATLGDVLSAEASPAKPEPVPAATPPAATSSSVPSPQPTDAGVFHAQAAQAASDPSGFAAAQPAPAATTGGGVSLLWWAAPLLFNIIGGAIAYFVVKPKDPGMARNLLIAGIVMTVVYAILLSGG